MKRWTILLYGMFSYLMFFGVFLYMVLFAGNLLVPKSLDSEPVSSFGFALTVNLLLIFAFAVQHSVMARPRFKRWLTKFIPESAERSTYVLASNIAVILIMAFWQPMGGVIWQAESMVLKSAITALYFLGWVVLFLSTCMICHFDLFGLRQTWLQFTGKKYTNYEFRAPFAYKYVRHPIYVGWLMIVWAAPLMSIAHLVFSLGMTVYILIAITWEENDLIATFGDKYTDYQKNVPMLIPSPRTQNSDQRIERPVKQKAYSQH